MSLIYGKAQSGDFDRLNELFIEMLRTIYNTEQVDGYAKGDMDRFFDGRNENSYSVRLRGVSNE